MYKVIKQVPIVLLSITAIVLALISTVHADPAGWIGTANPSLSLIRTMPSGTLYPDEPTLDSDGNIGCRDTSWIVGTTNTSICAVDGTYISSAKNNNYFLYGNSSKAGSVTPGLGYTSTIIANTDISYSMTASPCSYGSIYAFWDHTTASIASSNSGSNLYYTYPTSSNWSTKFGNNSNMCLNSSATSFSSNGKWMVSDIAYNSMVRINLETHEVLPFTTSLTSVNGGSTSLGASTAVSNDGRYIIVSGQTSARSAAPPDTRIYDLSTCSTTVPAAFTSPVSGCQYRNLSTYLNSSINTLRTIMNVRFSSNDKINFFARYGSTTVNGAYPVSKYTLYSPMYNAPSGTRYLALGDSFASGEGAYGYLRGTDENPSNLCHNSANSYPYVIKDAVSMGTFHSVACSGAVLRDITANAQKTSQPAINNSMGSWLPGKKAQIDYIDEASPSVITVDGGGNDINFKNKILKCVLESDTCYATKSERYEVANSILKQYKNMRNTYRSLKDRADSATIYVIGYPQIISTTHSCSGNMLLTDSQEQQFAQYLVSYLNYVTKKAADAEGVRYIDVENALQGKRLCDGAGRNSAVNGFTSGNDAFGIVGNESFHPNKIGHKLLANKIRLETNDFTVNNPAKITVPDPNINNTNTELANLLAGSGTATSNRYDIADPNQTTRTFFSGNNFTYSYTIGLNPAVKLGINTAFHVILNSTPVDIGTVTTDANGNLNVSVPIPNNTAPGLHGVQITGTDFNGEPVSISSTIYVGSSATDLDGDGIPNTTDSCLAVANSNVDIDENGQDDACQGYVDIPPLYRAVNGNSSIGQDPTKIYVERRVSTASDLGIIDYNPNSFAWVEIAHTTSSDLASSNVASFQIEDLGANQSDDTIRYIPKLSTRTNDNGCVQLKPSSTAAVTTSSSTAMTLVATDTNTCRSASPESDTDNNGVADRAQVLYRARNGDIANGEDSSKIYIERNIPAAEALLGKSDYATGSSNWALVGVGNGTYNKLVLTSDNGSSVLSSDGKVTQDMYNNLSASDLAQIKPLVLTGDTSNCSGITPYALSTVKIGISRGTIAAILPSGTTCN